MLSSPNEISQCFCRIGELDTTALHSNSLSMQSIVTIEETSVETAATVFEKAADKTRTLGASKRRSQRVSGTLESLQATLSTIHGQNIKTQQKTMIY